MDAWYLIYTKARRERAALENLQRQGYEAYLPRIRNRRRVGGRFTSVVEPMFPRYLFLKLNDTTDDWGPVRSTVGVSRLVRFGSIPAQLPDAFIATLRASEGDDGVHVRDAPALRAGQPIRIVEGPLSGLEAIYHAGSGSERVVVLLQVAERLVRVELGADLVETV